MRKLRICTVLYAVLTHTRFNSRALPFSFRLLAPCAGVPYVNLCQTTSHGPAVGHTEITSALGAVLIAARMRRTFPESVTTGTPLVGVTGVRRVSFVPWAHSGRRETGVRKHGRRILSNAMVFSAIVPFGTGGRSNE